MARDWLENFLVLVPHRPCESRPEDREDETSQQRMIADDTKSERGVKPQLLRDKCG
jgi:hypothetical protein